MNAMSALYHIAQNDTPTLNSPDWTAVFGHFVEVCLTKSPTERPSSGKLLSVSYLLFCYSRIEIEVKGVWNVHSQPKV